MIGCRIRFLEHPEITAHWRRNNPQEHHPKFGDQGTIIRLPPRGNLGGGPQVRWDNGHVTWLGSLSEYEIIK